MEVVAVRRAREVVIGQARHGGIAKPTSQPEDPMTDGRMALIEPPEQSGDGDFPRSVAAAAPRLLAPDGG
jgi:hypothetical protein